MIRVIASTVLITTIATTAAGPPPDHASAPPAESQPSANSEPRDVSGLIRPIREKHKVPGMVAAIVEDDQVIALAVDGVRMREHPEKVTATDQFHIGSCTKAMTATMIATLVDEGRLKWTTTIGEVFTNLADRMDPAWKSVTLEQLLCHRAGVPSDLTADGLWNRLWNHTGTPTEQRMTLVEGVLSHPPVHAPGTKYLYANAGFAIAGAMAERITGQAWEDLMRKRLFEPLGMSSAGFGAPGSVGEFTQPRGHHTDGTAVQPGPGSDNPAAIGPGGTVHCSIGDWAKFISLHLQAERGHPRIVSAESFAKLHTPYDAPGEPQYGMGWVFTTRPWAHIANPNARVMTHNGSNTMWFCVTWLAPASAAPGKDHGFAVLVMCNQGGGEADRACDEAAFALIQQFSKRPSTSATATTSPARSSPSGQPSTP